MLKRVNWQDRTANALKRQCDRSLRVIITQANRSALSRHDRTAEQVAARLTYT